MFTGIIKNTGILKEKSGFTMVFESGLAGIETGESIAVNGVCLTVERKERSKFYVRVSPQTLKNTTLASIKKGELVNLESSIKPAESFGGHLVTGHVDGTGKIKYLKKEKDFIIMAVAISKELMSGIVEKGSVAIDGISLTVSGINMDCITVTVIPYTFHNTNVSKKREGAAVNIELDIIGKYVRKYLSGRKIEITEEFLKNKGF